MGFVKRFGGWRPVQTEEGIGALRLADGAVLDEVGYRFEVWHQMVDGFPGPFRAEGELSLPAERAAAAAGATLVLEDGRLLPLAGAQPGKLLAHARPSDEDEGSSSAS